MGSETTRKQAHVSQGGVGEKNQKKRKIQSSPNLNIYWILALLRLALTLIPQTGYIHPDEYFQSIEIVAGDVFDLDIERPWEFNVTFPVRSILLPKLVYGLPYIVLNTLTPALSDALGYDIRTPYIMVLLPRIVACVLSFVTDYCLYRICVVYAQKYRSRLLILGSSYVLIVYGTRTLSNSIEMALTSLLLYLVADSMLISEKVTYQQEFLDDKYASASTPVERVKLFKMRAALPPHSLRHCNLIAATFVAGVFNRPTFLVFGFPPVVFWLQRGISSHYSGLRAFHIRIFVFVLCALPVVCIFILADSLYFGYLTWDEIGMGDIGLSSFVVTPFNFLVYNSRQTNLAQHGLHPRVTHMLVNIPVLYNVLGLIGIIGVSNIIIRASQARWRELPRIQSIVMLMTASILVPVVALSFVPHQEARFLIPITLPLVFLNAQEIRDMDTPLSLLYHKHKCIQTEKQSKTKPFVMKRKDKPLTLINIWIFLNLLLALFFGFLHQGGVFPLTSHIKEILRKSSTARVLHLVTSHMYPIPHSLLVQRNSKRQYFNSQTNTRFVINRKFYSYELGSQPMRDVATQLKDIIYEADLKKKRDSIDYQLYFALPSSLMEEFAITVGSNLTYTVDKIFYPHVSIEAFPSLVGKYLGEEAHLRYCSDQQRNLESSDVSVGSPEVGSEFCMTSEYVAKRKEFSFVTETMQIFKHFGLILLQIRH